MKTIGTFTVIGQLVEFIETNRKPPGKKSRTGSVTKHFVPKENVGTKIRGILFYVVVFVNCNVKRFVKTSA